MGKDNNIPVLDINNKFLSYTNPAKARILIKKGKAQVFCRSPYILRLQGEVGDGDMTIEELKSAKRSSLLLNFTRFFAVEKEIYVQNMTNTQVSMSFKSPNGDDYHIIVPKTRKPYNLTLEVPFDLVKISSDFRRMVTRNPQALRIIDEEEYMEYFENLADKNGTSFDDELGRALDIKDRLQHKRKLPDRIVRESEEEAEAKAADLEKPVEINSTVVGLCVRASKDYGDDRLRATDFMEELEMLGPNLTVNDWEFVSSKGIYKTVKDYASKQLDILSYEDDED